MQGYVVCFTDDGNGQLMSKVIDSMDSLRKQLHRHDIAFSQSSYLHCRFAGFLLQAAEFPLNELPHVLHNALASFVASCHEAAMQSVVVSLIKATTEPLEGQRQAKGAPAPGPATKGKAGLLIMLAIILRTRPQVSSMGLSEHVPAP